MTGDEHILDRIPAPAEALEKAVRRLRRTARGLRRRVRVRLSRPAAEPQADFVGTSVIPTIRYRDVPKAISWLTRAFGMKVHRVVTDCDGVPRYAELTVGAGMLMVAPIEDTAFGKLMVQPDEIGGVETQVCYLCVDDARAHAARAKAAGAVVIIDPDDEANRGRGYSCRDPEGHVWNFGVYDPWSKAQAPVRPPRRAPFWAWRPAWSALEGLGRVRLRRAAVAVVALALCGGLVSHLVARPDAGTAVTATAQALTPPPDGAPQQDSDKTTASGAPHAPIPVSAKADTDAGKAGNDPAPPPLDSAALEAANKAAAEARAKLASARSELARAEREANEARSRLAELQSAKQAADQAAAEARAKLATLQKAAERARAEAAQERARRLAIIRAATAKRRKSSGAGRVRPGATWCYRPGEPVRGAGRLSGFCKG